MIIDGRTQPGGWVGLVGSSSIGLDVQAPNSEVHGLAISGFANFGISLSGAGGSMVAGNRIGTDVTGTQYSASGDGISVATSPGAVIGGPLPADGNQVVTRPSGYGIVVASNPEHPSGGVSVSHNTIGTTADGLALLGPGARMGVVLLSSGGGQATISDNVVAANDVGVLIAGPGAARTTVLRNKIGTNRADSAPLGPAQYAVRIDGAPAVEVTANTLRSSHWDVSVAGSAQSDIGSDGNEITIVLHDPSPSPAANPVTGGHDIVSDNVIGALPDGTASAGLGENGVVSWAGDSDLTIDGNTIAGHTTDEIALFAGAGDRITDNTIGLDQAKTGVVGGREGILLLQHTTGVTIGGSNTSGNLIGGLTGDAIHLAGTGSDPITGTTISGNRLGLLDDGVTSAPNGGVGINLDAAPGTVIGPDNVIANNGTGGIRLDSSSTGSTITGNWIGLTQTGTVAAPNRYGISLTRSTSPGAPASNLTVSGNTVSSNTAGIGLVGDGNKILLNRVGVGPTTLSNLGNGGPGVVAIGTETEVRGNLVGHNTGDGIDVTGARAVVADNQVGQPTTGETDIGNGADGIAVTGDDSTISGNLSAHNQRNGLLVGASNNVTVTGNRLADNGGAGIASSSTATTISGNRIGIADASDDARPNATGIDVAGVAQIQDNRIAHNTGAGVSVAPAATVTIRTNPIFANGGPGIDSPTPAAPQLLVAARVNNGPGQTPRTWLGVKGPTAGGTLEVFGNPDCSDPEGKVPLLVKPWPGGDAAQVITVIGRPELTGYTVTYTDGAGKTSAFSTCQVASSTLADGDGDGIPDAIEALSPWPSATATNQLAAVPTDTGEWIGVVAPADGSSLRNVGPADDPSPGTRPPGLTLPFGLVKFQVTVAHPGDHVSASILLGRGVPTDGYWRYGAPAPGQAPRWYDFVPDDTTRTGAVKTQLTVDGQLYQAWVLLLQDGGRGDDDGLADGTVTDPGGPALGGVEPGGVEPGGVEPGGVEPGKVEPAGCPAGPASEHFVCRVYGLALGRIPESEGSAYWVQRLDAGQPRSVVAASFVYTPEARRVLVSRLYPLYLHRDGDPAGIDYWASRLLQGGTPDDVRVQLLASDEAYAKAGSNDPAWVSSVYQLMLHRDPDAGGLEYWAGQLRDGLSRSRMVASLLHTAEGRYRVVAEVYERFLSRTPSVDEASSWRDQLDAGRSELDVETQILATAEFYAE